MALVKNINGSSDNLPPRGYCSWKEFWEAKKNRRFSRCSCINCLGNAEVGGHVKKVNGTNAWYITPICVRHNNLPDTVSYVVRDDDLLPVNQ